MSPYQATSTLQILHASLWGKLSELASHVPDFPKVRVPASGPAYLISVAAG
jgi:hypothetical protein